MPKTWVDALERALAPVAALSFADLGATLADLASLRPGPRDADLPAPVLPLVWTIYGRIFSGGSPLPVGPPVAADSLS